jgi:hypothetical protein
MWVVKKEEWEMSMSRNDSTVPFFIFLVGIGVGATAVILLGSKRIDQLHDEVIEVINDGVKELRRQAQKTVNTAWQKLGQAIDTGTDAYGEAKRVGRWA